MDKSPDAFRTISEVAEDLDVPQHVLRFWETRFAQIKPLKRGGGRRYYRPDDVDLLRGIRHLLYGEGYTIRGVQRILKSEGVRFVQAVGRGEQTVESAGRGTEDGRDDGDESTVPAGADSAPLESAMAGAGLSAAAIARLEDALDDLLECQRLLQGLALADELEGAS
jgi:DNA-binding transcriptional MerR regulator